ncbi:glycosyltransferase family 2 protein [Patescibacteria group bacterium]
MKIKLSVVLATYNEEQNIKTCLTSTKDLADEIIVVDGSSKDQTRSIAKKIGAKVYKTTNKPIFHLNKQMAVDKATNKWILQLDADEQLTPELIKEIKIVIQDKKAKEGYYLPRKNWFLSRFLTKGGQYPDYVIRLFKKGKGHFPCKSVHEQIEINGSIGYLKNPLIHYSDPNFKRYLARFNRYTSLDAQKLLKEKIKPNLFLGLQYLIFRPIHWFLLTYFRHKGFVDGLPGFIFSLMSSLRFPVIFIKLWELHYARRS